MSAMALKFGREWSARRTVVTAIAAGVVAAVVAIFVVPAEFTPLIAWDVAAAVYLIVTWHRILGLDAGQTAKDARLEDPTRAGADLMVLVAAVASLVAVGYVIVGAGAHSLLRTAIEAGLGVVSVVVSWAVVHTVFTLRYARLYYSDTPGGVDFHDEHRPRFSDFAYLAFTVGMTFQVSDTELNSSAIRRSVLQHALLSYLFGTVIVALTINLVAGLTH
ncbi:DUF1345 domain-containing protein [Dactylosporangium sp. CA-092794]|uniref:DUF1345 domain-containing protein n=1 Tax=Dactylosporangium sp. CA-092794 TaxID=3239929 RepID=UPI003D90FF61